MTISINSIKMFLFFIFLICIPFQDTGMKNTGLGFLGYYLSIIPLLILIILHAISDKIRLNKVFVILFTWIITISLVMMIPYYGNGYESYMLYKIFSNTIIMFLWLYTVYFTINSSDNVLKYGLIVAFLINFASVIVSDVYGINDGFFIHSSENFNYRPRGFCSESSWFGYTSVILGGLLFTLIEKRKLQVLIAIATFTLVLFSFSKGSVLCLTITLLYYFWQKTKQIKNKLILISLLMLVVWLYIYPVITSSVLKDIEYYTSFATRFSSVISSIVTIITYPFGTGFGSFSFAYRDSLLDSFYILEQISGFQLNSSEIESYVLYDIDTKGATIKSIIFQWIAYFGLPFLFVMIEMCIKVYKLSECDIRCRTLFIFLLLANLLYSPFMFESCVCIGVLYRKLFKRKISYEKIDTR